MSKLIGRFYFKKTQNGNLVGEYSNNGMMAVDSECSNIDDTKIDDSDIELPDLFNGNYISVWHDGKETKEARLNIKPKHGTTGIYSLKWTALNNTIVFWGEGMIVDGILIGDYRNFDLI
jgi:hypothetical protein